MAARRKTSTGRRVALLSKRGGTIAFFGDLFRPALLILAVAPLNGCAVTFLLTQNTWRWATGTEKESHRIKAEVKWFHGQEGKPDLLVLDVAHIQNVEDGLYTVEIPPDWQETPRVGGSRTSPAMLEPPLDLQLKPFDHAALIADGRVGTMRYVRTQEEPSDVCPYFLGGFVAGTWLMAPVAGLETPYVVLGAFDWRIRKVLVRPYGPAVAVVATPVTLAADIVTLPLQPLFVLYLFTEPQHFPDCGGDPTPDDLTCDVYAHCGG